MHTVQEKDCVFRDLNPLGKEHESGARRLIASEYQVFPRRTAAAGLDHNVHLHIDAQK